MFAPGSPGLLSADAQFDFLQADLEKAKSNPDLKGIFTFSNSPIYSPGWTTTELKEPASKKLQNDRKLMGLFKEYNVKAHFGGYSHAFSDDVIESVPDIISGFLGGFVPSSQGGC